MYGIDQQEELMEKVDKATQVIDEWLWDNHSITQDTGNPRDIAQRLADAGLLAAEQHQNEETK
ncbi:hypothetical protein FRC0291_01176 [Corynebacterium diphtheriae]|nr:hypothetical protein FRC0291_01176 [Corynebacterium diphtheriae]